jgi:hypothetical protein
MAILVLVSIAEERSRGMNKSSPTDTRREEKAFSAHDEAKARIFPVLTEIDPEVQKCIVMSGAGGDRIFRIRLMILFVRGLIHAMDGVRWKEGEETWVVCGMYFLLFCPGTGDEGRRKYSRLLLQRIFYS